MSKIVYLLGAGASRGKRTWDNKPLGWEEIDLEDTNDIIEGLPLVSEIPARLDYIIKKIENIPDTAKTSSICFPIGSNMGTSYEEAKRIIISDLTWLKNESEKHATIDTFAKKLYLKGLKQEKPKCRWKQPDYNIYCRVLQGSMRHCQDRAEAAEAALATKVPANKRKNWTEDT